jgi:phenylalanyl-tRNA synthetase beta chain
MPVVTFDLRDFLRLLGRRVETAAILRCTDALGMETQIEGEEIRIEVPHNRPDLLSPEGVARVLKGMLGIQTGLPRYQAAAPRVRLEVERSVSAVRPLIAAGVVRGVELDEMSLVSIMQTQEKLHETYCRRRRKASIGVYDLDKVRPPIYYRAVRPEEVRFVPLGMSEELNLREILERHPKGVEYGHLLEGMELFPLLVDSEGTVLSMPPIVNSEDTKVTVETKNLFIDVTGLDERTVTNSLKILMCAMAERGFKLEAVGLPGGPCPNLAPKRMRLDLKRACQYIGIELGRSQAQKIFRRMRFELVGDTVLVPPFRADVMHEVDLIEELAVGYGYDKLEPSAPRVATIGETHELERLSRKVRGIMLGLGFTEVMNYILTNPRINFELMGLEGEAVEIANPISEEYTILRTWLLPSLLSTCQRNKLYGLPQRFFEVGDVVLPELRGESARTLRKVAAVQVGGNFTQMKAVAESLLRELSLRVEPREGEHPSFMEGRVLKYYRGTEEVGVVGEVHPRVLLNFELGHPVAALEFLLAEHA